jgi:CheY-like chemotaxis protein
MAKNDPILIAEDDNNDFLLIQRAFEKAQIKQPVRFVKDGAEAIAYLKGEGEFSDRKQNPLPAVLLLDLKMPRMDGFEVLNWLRSQPGLKTLPVIVLTTSQDMKDLNKAYQLGANSFLVKPLDFEHFVNLSNIFHSYWLQSSIGPDMFRLPE